MWDSIWVGVGLLGQGLFLMRFLVQWIASEREQASVIPVVFWYFSIGGATMLLAYAIHIKDPVFVLGQSTGFAIYFRNLWFIRKNQQPEDQQPTATA